MFSRLNILIANCVLTSCLLSSIGLGATLQVFVRVLPRDAPVEMIQIRLRNVRSGETLRNAVLHEPGIVTFNGVRSGNYLVRAESAGFEAGETEIAINSFSRADQALTTVTLKGNAHPLGSLPERVDSTVSIDTLSIPQKALDEMEEAHKASQAEDPARAVKHLRKALDIHPRLYQAYNNLAVEYTKLGHLNEAAQALEQSIAIQPDDATTHRNLAQLYLAFGRSREALTLVQKSLEFEPKNSKSLLLLGRLKIRFGDCKSALEHFYLASSIDKTDHFYIGIGQCLTLLGRYPEALTEFKSFVDLFPDDPRASGVMKVIAQLEADLSVAGR